MIIHKYHEQAIRSMQKILYKLDRLGISISVLCDLIKFNSNQQRQKFRNDLLAIMFKRESADYSFVMPLILKIYMYAQKYRSTTTRKDLYMYMIDKMRDGDHDIEGRFELNSPGFYEPVSYDDKHGGDVCEIQ